MTTRGPAADKEKESREKELERAKEKEHEMSSHAFQQALRFMVSLPTHPAGMAEISRAERLSMYGLWLQFSYGICNAEQNPYPFSKIQSEKWEAWKRVGNLTQEEAAEAFIVKTIGFLKAYPSTKARQDLLYQLEKRKTRPVILYGDMRDPATRAITWLCILCEIPLDFEKIEMGSFPTEYLPINKQGHIPFINDNGFIVNEGTSIMKYLASVFILKERLYPNNIISKTNIDQFLDWAIFTSVVLKPSARAEERARPLVEEALSKIENIWLSKSDPDSLEGADEAVENGKKTKNCYISGRGSATIADLLAYCEVKQIMEWIPWYIESDKYPNITAWMKDVASFQGCEEAHKAYEVALDQWRAKRPTQIPEIVSKL